jgi:hypothetical protein
MSAVGVCVASSVSVSRIIVGLDVGVIVGVGVAQAESIPEIIKTQRKTGHFILKRFFKVVIEILNPFCP